MFPRAQPSSRHEYHAEQGAQTVHRSCGSGARYEGITALDQARQHIGDASYGPVTFGNASSAPEEIVSAEQKAERARIEEERNRLMKSLVFDQMDSRYLSVRSRSAGTCEWLLETPQYKDWQNPALIASHHGFFWIKGNAGVGKSTLMKYAADHATATSVTGEHQLVFFFNARGGQMETSPDGLFRSLLHQLLEKFPDLYASLDKRRFDVAKRQGWSTALLQDTFSDAILELEDERVTCFIDAMDECQYDDIEDIVRFFDDLGDSAAARSRKLYVCLSSRHYPNVKISRSVELVLENQRGHDDDIREFVRRRLLIEDDKLKEDFVRLIEKKASGIFLWVALVVSLLNGDDRYGNVHDMRKRLDQLPPALSELFDELLGRGARNKYLRPLLQWATFGTRALGPEELYHALLYETEESEASETISTNARKNMIDKFILNSSKGLVEGGTRVQFIHESVRTYFLGDGLRHLIDNDGVARTSSAEDSSEGAPADTSRMLIAWVHDQLKYRCLNYLTSVVSSRMASLWGAQGATDLAEHTGSLPNATQEETFTLPKDSNQNYQHLETHILRTPWEPQSMKIELYDVAQRKAKINNRCPFFEYAIQGLWKHAEQAHKHGFPQQSFLDALPWPDLKMIARNSAIYLTGTDANVQETEWHKACYLAANQCTQLLELTFNAILPSRIESWHWGVILASSLAEAFEARSHTYMPYHYEDTGNRNVRGYWKVAKQLLDYGTRPFENGICDADCPSGSCERGCVACICMRTVQTLKVHACESPLASTLILASREAEHAIDEFFTSMKFDIGKQTGVGTTQSGQGSGRLSYLFYDQPLIDEDRQYLTDYPRVFKQRSRACSDESFTSMDLSS